MSTQQGYRSNRRVQQKSYGNHQNNSFLSMKLKDVQEQLEIMDGLYREERANRLKAESDGQKQNTFIYELEQGLSFYKRNDENRQKSVKYLQVQLREKEQLCEDLQQRLDTESQLRVPLETKRNDSVSENLLAEISQLEQGLDFYQNKVETCSERILDLETQLQEKEALCESLQNSLKQGPQLKVQPEEERRSCQKKDLIHDSLKNKNGELLKMNKDLINKLEAFNSRKSETEEKLRQELEVLKLQLEDKSSLCEKLETSFKEEHQLRVNQEAEMDKYRVLICHSSGLHQEIQDLKQENAVLRAEMDKRNSEKVASEQAFAQELRKVEKQFEEQKTASLSLDSELARSRETARLNAELMARLTALEETQTDLQSVIVDLQLEKMTINEQHEEELETLKQLLEEKNSLEVQPGSEVTFQEPETSVESLETNPDEDRQLGTDVCSQTEMCEETSESGETNKGFPENDSELEEVRLEDETEEDETVGGQNREKISMWRRFKKCITPACLRKNKVRS